MANRTWHNASLFFGGVVPIAGVMVLVPLMVLLLHLTNPSPAFAACSLTSGTDDVHKWTGAGENVASIQGVKANLWNYNPDPVFQTSSFWAMLTENEEKPDRWAQVGWYKAVGNSWEYVFLEFTDDSGVWYDYFYDASTDSWTGTPSTVPNSSKTYEVTYASGSPGTFSMKYSSGSAYSVPYSWSPSRLEVYGETLNYAISFKGDHVPGDTSNKIEANTIKKKVSGSWTNASPTYQDEGHGAYDNNVTLPGFRIWDQRCSE